jgi:hypothetical protein
MRFGGVWRDSFPVTVTKQRWETESRRKGNDCRQGGHRHQHLWT